MESHEGHEVTRQHLTLIDGDAKPAPREHPGLAQRVAQAEWAVTQMDLTLRSWMREYDRMQARVEALEVQLRQLGALQEVAP